jgi:hypothetical protein
MKTLTSALVIATLTLALPGAVEAQSRSEARGLLRGLFGAAARNQPTPDAAQQGQMGPGDFCERWDSSTRTRFHHIITAPPGRARLHINARTSSPGGETVAIYPSNYGERGNVRIMFVIATTRGHAAVGHTNIPQPAPGENLGQLPIVVDVENNSGRRQWGEYCITVHPE